MFLPNLLLPFVTMIAGAVFGLVINSQNGLLWGGIVGFGIGCAILIILSALLAFLKRKFPAP